MNCIISIYEYETRDDRDRVVNDKFRHFLKSILMDEKHYYNVIHYENIEPSREERLFRIESLDVLTTMNLSFYLKKEN